MRSPMRAKPRSPSGITTAFCALVTTNAGRQARGTGVRPAASAAKRSMCAGVVPQHPPSTLAPWAMTRSMARANSSGPTS